jgi:hypothetical protein
MNARRGLATIAFLVLGVIADPSYVPRVEAAEPSDPFPMWDKRILDGSKRFVPRFPGIGGTVGAYLDRETGLVWTALPSLQLMDWTGAVNHCVGLRVGGLLARGGWRLPSIEELTSLLPVEDPLESGGGLARFWTATTFPTNPSQVYTVSGHTDPQIVEENKSTVPTNEENKLILPWCVRGGRGFDRLD